MIHKYLYPLCVIAVYLGSGSAGQGFCQTEAREYPRVTEAYVVRNAQVTVKPGLMLSNTSLFIEDGLIKGVGKDIPIPGHARIIDADSLFVYAGFIDGMSHTGIPKKEEKKSADNSGDKIKDPGNPPNGMAGIQTEVEVRNLLDAGDKAIAELRQEGFTMAHVVPRGLMFPGQGSLILLNGSTADEMVLKENISVFSQLKGARRMYPSTVIGVMAKWREMYRQAEYFTTHARAFETGGIARPKYDAPTAALVPVVRKEKPVYFYADDMKTIHRAILLQDDLGFDLVLAGVTQAWYLKDRIAEKHIPVFVSLDLPEDKSKEDKKKNSADKQEPVGKPDSDTTLAAVGDASDSPAAQDGNDAETKALEERRKKSLQEHYSQAKVLAEAGIPFGFTTIDVKTKDIRPNLLKMVESGLPEEKAIAALTTVPAKLLGMENYTGTVEKGKMANLVISTKPFFHKDSNIKYVFVDGQLFEYETKEKKTKGGDSGGKPANVAGTWSFEVAYGDDGDSGSITITGTRGNFQGKLIRDGGGEETALDDIEVNGSNLTFRMTRTFDGQSLVLEFDLEVQGEEFEGTVSVGTFGSYAIEGTRIAGPNR